MKLFLTILLIFTISLTSLGQSQKLTAKKQSNVTSENIVITEETYNKLTDPSINKRKLSKISDREDGKPKRSDDPMARVSYERNLLKNPLTGKIPWNIKKLEKDFVLSSAAGLQSRLKAGGLDFTLSGPKNVGGRTRALAIDMNNENIILAGGVSGGMWKSVDNGVSWTRTTSLDDNPSVTSIAQDPNNTSVWYYTTGELVGNSASEPGAPFRGNGLFKSTDNGDSWTSLTSTASNTSEKYDPFDYSWTICIDPTNSDIYLATADGITRSTDGGTSWTTVITSDSFYEDIIITANGVKYATLSSSGSNKGIYRSATGNSGDWENITPTNFPADYKRIVLANATNVTSEDIVYFLAETNGAGLQGHSFWKLTYTTSAAWEDRSQNLPEGGEGGRDVNGYDSQGSYNMVIKVAPDNENMVFIGGTNLFRSDDAFATSATPLNLGKTGGSNTYWIGGYATENTVAQYPNHHPDVHSLVFKSDNTTLLCGHDGGVSITSDFKKDSDTTPSNSTSTPVDWEFLNNGYLTTQAYTVAIDEDITTSEIMISGFQDNGTWLGRNASSNTNWEYFSSGDGSYCSILNMGEHFLSSSQNGVVYLETDPKGSDPKYTRVDPEGAEGQLFINPFIVDAINNEIMYYAAGQYIWRNSNIFEIPQFQTSEATRNWEKLEVSNSVGTVSALESSIFPSHRLYYGTTAGKIYRMDNSHSQWASKTDITGSNMPVGNINSIDANPRNANEVLVCFSNYGVESVFYTDNGGTSWTAVSGNLEDESVNNNGPSTRTVSIMVTPTDTTYYVGASTGLYSTTVLNGNSTVWTQEASDKIGTSVLAMLKTRRDGFIAAATHGNGIFTANADFSSSAPIALIGIKKDTIQIGESVDFMNKTIGDGITGYEWTFDGAETTSSTNEYPTGIQYNTPGVYTVTLTATNGAGSNTQTIETGIVVKSVQAKFSVDKRNINVGDQVVFTDKSSATATKWTWSFPGGTPESSTEENPTVTYNTVGDFDVTLTVGDDTFTDTEIRKAYITVLDPDDFDDRTLYNVEPEFEESLSQFVFTGDNSGYVTGHTNLKIDEYAEKFEMINPNLNAVKQVQILPTHLQSNSGSPEVIIKIWNGTTEPTDLVYKKAVPFSLLTKGEFNTIDLDFPVAVEKDFFVGYQLKYDIPVDTFAVAHLPLEADGGWANTAYMYYSDAWRAYGDVFGGGLNTSLAIKALVGYDAGATGIEDEITAKVEDLLIYPNPMVHQSNVVFPNENNKKYRLIVVDASGRVVRIIENITGNNVIINREQLKSGVHIINVRGEKIFKGKLLVK